jgi:hypothetical protein
MACRKYYQQTRAFTAPKFEDDPDFDHSINVTQKLQLKYDVSNLPFPLPKHQIAMPRL